MNEYTASNGLAITWSGMSDWAVDGKRISRDRFEALREFFRAEEDERLGRRLLQARRRHDQSVHAPCRDEGPQRREICDHQMVSRAAMAALSTHAVA